MEITIITAYLIVGVFLAMVTSIGAIYTDKMGVSLIEIFGVFLVILLWPAIILYAVYKYTKDYKEKTSYSGTLTLTKGKNKETYNVKYRNSTGDTRIIIKNTSTEELKNIEGLLALIYDLEFSVDEEVKKVKNGKLKA